jgi:indolepyruvate ferredoxin oxidoreductase
MAAFVDGLDMVLVVEEKRSLLESQMREALYGTAQAARCGRQARRARDWLFPVKGALDPNDIAVAVGERVLKVIGHAEDIDARVKRIRQFQSMLATVKDVSTPNALFLLRAARTIPRRGAGRLEGRSPASAAISWRAGWTRHVRLYPDGRRRRATGSGRRRSPRVSISSRISATAPTTIPARWRSGAIASGANITYKILYNDAVAMTGGQTHEGGLTA